MMDAVGMLAAFTMLSTEVIVTRSFSGVITTKDLVIGSLAFILSVLTYFLLVVMLKEGFKLPMILGTLLNILYIQYYPQLMILKNILDNLLNNCPMRISILFFLCFLFIGMLCSVLLMFMCFWVVDVDIFLLDKIKILRAHEEVWETILAAIPLLLYIATTVMLIQKNL